MLSIMDEVTALVDFVKALEAQDFDAVKSRFAPDVRFRALIPPGAREASGCDEASGYLQRWFGAADRVELVRSDVHAVGDRVSLRYAFRIHEDRWYDVEQQAFCTMADGRIASIDLLCSGFRPL